MFKRILMVVLLCLLPMSASGRTPNVRNEIDKFFMEEMILPDVNIVIYEIEKFIQSRDDILYQQIIKLRGKLHIRIGNSTPFQRIEEKRVIEVHGHESEITITEIRHNPDLLKLKLLLLSFEEKVLLFLSTTGSSRPPTSETLKEQLKTLKQIRENIYIQFDNTKWR